ncbi:MAG: BatD family protein [Schleiferiaceae bacterium]|jgi:hypothetical protein|nr:BatD family protein [Schleiferiaceae bacterium]
MKRIQMSVVAALLCSLAFAQEAKITLDKDSCSFDEVIKVTFESDFKPDSVNWPTLNGFLNSRGPNTMSSVKMTNGNMEVQYAKEYHIRPAESGMLTISSPEYFYQEKRIMAEPRTLFVSPNNMSEEELKEQLYLDFIHNGIKPKGTKRVTFHEDKGYIEVFGELGWKIERRLTEKELKKIGGLK